jgi:hypothetical protein
VQRDGYHGRAGTLHRKKKTHFSHHNPSLP